MKRASDLIEDDPKRIEEMGGGAKQCSHYNEIKLFNPVHCKFGNAVKVYKKKGYDLREATKKVFFYTSFSRRPKIRLPLVSKRIGGV